MCVCVCVCVCVAVWGSVGLHIHTLSLSFSVAVWPSAGLNTPSGSTRTYTHKRLGTHTVQRTQDAGMHSTCILHALFVNARLLVSVTETLPHNGPK